MTDPNNPPAIGSNRINQLRKLSETMPNANQNVANQINSTREIQLQNMIKQAPATAPTAATAQTIGAKQAEQRGQINMQTADQTQKDLTQVGQTALQNQQLLNNQKIGSEGRRVSAKQQALENMLARMNQDAKNKILDQQLQFKRDQNGQAFLNERQLADWAIMNARNEQDFLNWQQQMEQVSERKIQMLEVAYKKIKQALEHGYIGGKQAMDNNTRERMKNAANKLEEKIQKEFSDFAVRKAMFSAGGTVIGAVVGGVAAGYFTGGMAAPEGAAVGAGVGGGLGTAAAGAS